MTFDKYMIMQQIKLACATPAVMTACTQQIKQGLIENCFIVFNLDIITWETFIFLKNIVGRSAFPKSGSDECC